MHSNAIASRLALGLSLLPVISLADRLSSQCTGLRVADGWLAGKCATSEGSSTLISSSVYLNHFISYNQSKLQWAPSSGRFSDKCVQCNVQGSVMSCTCEKQEFVYEKASIDLAQYIDNYDGYLLSNLTKAAVAPLTRSTYPVPPDLFWMFSYITDDKCKLAKSPYDFNRPITCNRITKIDRPGYNDWGWAISRNVGWELTVYNTEDCSGQAMGTLGPQDIGPNCTIFPSPINSMSLRPLWNADYDRQFAR